MSCRLPKYGVYKGISFEKDLTECKEPLVGKKCWISSSWLSYGEKPTFDKQLHKKHYTNCFSWKAREPFKFAKEFQESQGTLNNHKKPKGAKMMKNLVYRSALAMLAAKTRLKGL